MAKKLNLLLAQINPTVGDFAGNLAQIKDCVASADDDAIIIFPETVLTGYPPDDLVLRNDFLDQTHDFIDKVCALTNGNKKVILLPTPYNDKNIRYNACLVIANGEVTDKVYKQDLPNYDVFDEKRIFMAGPETAPVTINGTKIGILICEDIWQPKIAASLKKQGAELFIVVNASPFEGEKLEIRHALIANRASENGVPICYLNLFGGQDELVFDGGSFIVNESGKVIFQGESFAKGIYKTSWIKTENQDHWLIDAPESYPPPDHEEALYNAMMVGLRDYTTKNGFASVLLGVSGGVDSALVAALAVDALGPSAVHGFMLPTDYTSDESHADARALANNLGFALEDIAIKDIVAPFNKTIEDNFSGDILSITFENIQSRTRGSLLMAISNTTGFMLLSTGNKSEMATGYATLYGDMNGGFNPIKDLYKTDLYKVCKWRNQNHPKHGLGPSGSVIPENILTKAPTAELKDNQTDQDSLPEYDVLDDILRGLIDRDDSPADLAQTHDPETVDKVWAMLNRNEYKRFQSPPGPKLSRRAFGRNRRYPLTNRFK